MFNLLINCYVIYIAINCDITWNVYVYKLNAWDILQMFIWNHYKCKYLIYEQKQSMFIHKCPYPVLKCLTCLNELSMSRIYCYAYIYMKWSFNHIGQIFECLNLQNNIDCCSIDFIVLRRRNYLFRSLFHCHWHEEDHHRKCCGFMYHNRKGISRSAHHSR